MTYTKKYLPLFTLLLGMLFLTSGCLFLEIVETGLNLRDTTETIIVSDGKYLYKSSKINYVSTSNKTTLTRTSLLTAVTETYLGTSSPAVTDGTGSAVRFYNINSLVAIPNSTTIYIGDQCTIRRLNTETHTVTTILGVASSCVASDGVGLSARFTNFILGLAYHDNFLYVADGYTLRKVNLQNLHVTTVAGSSNMPGDQNGVGTFARFGELSDLVYLNSYIYFIDTSNKKIRKMSIDTYEVSTVFGDGTSSSLDGIGTSAKLDLTVTSRLTTDGSKLIFFTENLLVRKANIESLVVTTLIDSRDAVEDIDGPVETAKTFYPSGIAYTLDGLFIANYFGIRRLR